MAWGQLDYLVVDTPPGTSDEHMAAVDALRPYSPLGAIVVTTPQVLQSIVPFFQCVTSPRWAPLPALYAPLGRVFGIPTGLSWLFPGH